MSQRRGPPAHQNKVAWEPFRADKHNSAKKIIEQQPVDGVCAKCADSVLSRRKQYPLCNAKADMTMKVFQLK